jgi:uncharacterized membrane protein YphA (DoxX/SURF4 family)
VVNFLQNLGLFLVRLVTGCLVSFFAAREMAGRSDIILKTLEFYSIGAPDIVKVFVGCMVLIFGALMVIGFWTRFIALALLVLLGIGGYCWSPQVSQVHFHLEAVYGIILFYLVLVGGGQWAVTRKRVTKGQSVLEAEQSIFASDDRPSIFNKGDAVVAAESTLEAPVVSKDVADSEPELEEDDPILIEEKYEDPDFEDKGGDEEDKGGKDGPQKSLF